MADADSDSEIFTFSGNIYSPIHPSFHSTSTVCADTLGRFDDGAVTCAISSVEEYNSRLDRQSSIVDGLLSEIYDHWHDHRHDSFDSDTFTECSSTSEFVNWRRHSVHLEIGGRQLGYLHQGILQDYEIKELKNLLTEMSRHVSQMSTRLVRQLKRRERRMSKLQNNCDIVTAIIQASSPKRQIDTRMRFSVEPAGGDSAFEQWKDAMKAVARLPLGIPAEFRKKVWLSLAEQHIKELKIDWEKTVKFAFNERSNPDDNKLGVQIVKDLHRTGCSGFSGEENEEERALLKRILLAYARWNKVVGYCQGFNMIAALLLEVMDRKESDALKVMIYLIDHVLPQGYFANNLRALSVDMAVFRDLLKIFPKLSRHLDYLQHAQDQTSGGCYEPPLTNVFTMQWFLTLFATCLPKSTVLRVWDSILLDGSEILLRTALVIWGKLSSRILTASSADEFYTLMGDITQEMLEGNILDGDTIIKSIYNIAPFPLPQLTELREKYTYNIRPFTPASKKASWPEGAVLPSDEDDLEEEDLENITCFAGFIPTVSGSKHKGLEVDQRTGSLPDISSLGPGAYGMGSTDGSSVQGVPAYMERMTTDINALKKQYLKLRQRQNQAHIIITSATARHQAMKTKPMMPKIETPVAMNHLFLNKRDLKGRNRFVAEGPRIANMYPVLEPQALSGQGKTKNSNVVGNSQKWNRKVQSSKNTTSRAHNTAASKSDSKSEVNIKEPAVPIKCELKVEAKASKGSEYGTDETLVNPANSVDNEVKEDIEESQHNEECVHRPLQHNDSGLGLSIVLLSGSSTESSPQHSCESRLMDQCHNHEHSITEVCENDKSDQVSDCEEGYDKGLCIKEEALFIVADRHDTRSESMSIPESKDGCKEVSESVIRSTENKSDDKGLTECSESDNSVLIVKESGDSLLHGSGFDDVRTAGATGDYVHATTDVVTDVIECDSRRVQMVGGQNESSADENCSADLKTSEELMSNTVIPKDGEKDQIKTGLINVPENDILKEIDQTQHCNVSIPSCSKADRLSSSDTLKNKSPNRSDSLTSTVSVLSVEEMETMPEVFSPTSVSGQPSFQQYYINKRNLSGDGGDTKSYESHVKKTQLPKKMFYPFPVKHMNQNRAKTGIKLGLYKPSTLQEYERNLKGQPVWGK